MGNQQVGYTPGTGDSVSADLVDLGAGAALVEHMKLVDGTEGGTAVIPGDADRGLRVEPVTRRIGIQVTPTLDTSPYAANDVLFSATTLANAGRANVGTGQIQSVVLLDKTQAQRAEMDLFFFSAAPAGTYTPNAVLALTDADMALCIGWIPIRTADYQDAFGGTPLNSIAQVHPAGGIQYDLAGATDLHVLGRVNTSTPTYAASDLTLTVFCQVD